MEANSDGPDSAPPSKRVRYCDEANSVGSSSKKGSGLASSPLNFQSSALTKVETKADDDRMESHSDCTDSNAPPSKRVKYSDESNSVGQSRKEGHAASLSFQSSAAVPSSGTKAEETKVDDHRMESNPGGTDKKRMKYSDESNSVPQENSVGHPSKAGSGPATSLLNAQTSAVALSGTKADDYKEEPHSDDAPPSKRGKHSHEPNSVPQPNSVGDSRTEGLAASLLISQSSATVAPSGTKAETKVGDHRMESNPNKKRVKFSDDSNSAPSPNSVGQSGKEGLAASLLNFQNSAVAFSGTKVETKADEFLDLPHSVLQVTATGLRCDLILAGLLSRGLLETVLCVPKGLINVPVRLSKGLLNKSNTCEVIDTQGLLLPSVVTAALGSRPKRYLATRFAAEDNSQGMCFALWLDPATVPDVAEDLMSDAGRTFPLLLANRVQAQCCDRMGRRFDSIMKRMPQSVVFVDDKKAPCLINEAAAVLLDLPNAGEADPAQVASGMRKLADRSKNRGNTYRCFNWLVSHPDQCKEWEWELTSPRSVLRVRSFPITSLATIGRVWLFDDVTREKDAHDAIQEANVAKSQFLAMMSHELRTPMTGVLGMLDLLLLTSLTPEQGAYIKVMQVSAESLMQVLNEILDFSKIQSGRLALESADFHIGVLLDQVKALFQGKLQEKNLSLTISKPLAEEMAVRGDSNRLRQVLTNLLSNAIKFTERGGIVITWKHVSRMAGPPGQEDRTDVPECVVTDEAHAESEAEPHQDRSNQKLPLSVDTDSECESSGAAADALPAPLWFEVRVTDTGIGLTREQQGRLFQSFSQADSSTTRKFGGTGLGLAICKGVVEAMGGRIWVESEAGEGSTFAFCVPLRPALRDGGATKCLPEVEVEEVKAGKGATLRVLVAEDNEVNQLLIRKMLKHYGHEVELVGNGQLAVDKIQTGQYDMILMDLQMPVMDGLSATKAIRALGGRLVDIPIFALTADVLTQGRESLDAMGLTGYMTKPINWDDLSEKLKHVVQSKSMREGQLN